MSTQEKVLIVEDEPHALSGLAELVSGWGYRTETARDGIEALEKIASWQPGIIVSDFKMPRMDGLQLLSRMGENTNKIAFVMLTAQGSIEAAVEAMKTGAYDFIQKPVDPARLRAILTNAARQRDTERELEVTRRKLRETGVLGSLVGASKKMQEVFTLIERIAPSTSPVLITGESGTGKELAARCLHDLSSRRQKPFVAVNCAAIPETLIESEIFGHEKGAFTGAIERRAGCFELAEEGTLLLDEIGEMPAATQAKLLRVLEDRKLRRLGSKAETPIDVRVHRRHQQGPAAGGAERPAARRSLLSPQRLQHPDAAAARAQAADIPAIVAKMIDDMNQKHQLQGHRHRQRDLLARLVAHDWPGNVRELRNAIERAVVLCGEGQIQSRHLPPGFGTRLIRAVPELPPNAIQLEVGATVDDAERMLIFKTLESTHNNKTRAAEILGISLKTLHNKLREYGSTAATAGALEE
jgi:DNA-binding NtrC family response regulator